MDNNNMRGLLDGMVLGRSLKLGKEMKDLEADQDEMNQNKAIDEALGRHANEMTGEEREERLRETPKGTFEP